MTRQQERIGLVCAGLCAVNGAFVPALAKLTTNVGEPFLVATATTVFGGMAALSMLLLRGRARLLFDRRHFVPLLAVGTLGSVIAFLLFYAGASRTSAIEAVLCLQIEPAYSLLLAWLVLGHRPTRRRIMATAMLLLGIALAVGARGMTASVGVWLLLITPLAWQLSHLVMLRRLPGVSPDILTGARYIFGSVMLLAIWASTGGVRALPEWRELADALPLLAVQGVILSYVGTLLWYGAVTRLDLARTTSIVVPSVPLLSIAASFLLLGEVPSPSQWVGLVLTAAGVFAFVTAPHVRSRFEQSVNPVPTVAP